MAAAAASPPFDPSSATAGYHPRYASLPAPRSLEERAPILETFAEDFKQLGILTFAQSTARARQDLDIRALRQSEELVCLPSMNPPPLGDRSSANIGLSSDSPICFN